MTRRTLNPGDYLWHEGDAPGEVVMILEGELEIVHESADGELVIINTSGVGEWLGEMSSLDASFHSATVRARQPCTVQRWTASEFRAWLREDPARYEELIARQSVRLRQLGAKVAQLGFDPVRTRLARALCELCAERESVAITHHDLAARIATTRESVSKALGGLARAGLVRLSRGSVAVLDRQGLQQEASN